MIGAVRKRAGFVAALIAVLTVLSGCTSAAVSGSADRSSDGVRDSTEPTAPVATPAVPGMRGQAVRLRTDAAVGGQFQTRITNTGSEAFMVLGVSLDSPGFERLPFAGRPATYNPGATIDLPTQYGAVLCADDIQVDPAFTALQVQQPDGRIEELRVPLEAPDDIIDRIHQEECNALALAAAVDVSLGEFSSAEVDGRTVVQATITLTRGSNTEEEIALTELRGSVVFDVSFADSSEAPPAMTVEEDQLVVPVILRHTARGCDAHVLAETKQPFVFPFLLSFDGGTPQYGILDVSPEQRDALWSYIRAVCPNG